MRSTLEMAREAGILATFNTLHPSIEILVELARADERPDSPFHWAHNQQPSIFVRDVFFRAKNVIENTDYKAFGIYSRATPHIKPQLNKHEL